MTKKLFFPKWLCCHSSPLMLNPPPLFGKCQNDKVHEKSTVAENEGILSVHEFNYHSDGST